MHKRKRLSALVSLFAISALGLGTMSPAHASEGTVGTGMPPKAEVREIIEGDDVIVVFPVTDTPPEGEDADLIYVGDVDEINEDAHVVIARSDGTLPGGASAEDVRELDARGALTKDNVAAESAGVAGLRAARSTCFQVTALPGITATGYGTSAYIGTSPFARIAYEARLVPGTNQQGSASGLGFNRVQSGGQIYYERGWWPMGIVGADSQTTGTAPWGEVSATPGLQLRSTGVHAAQVRVCT